MARCVKCGYCCTRVPCPFGYWDEAKHQCIHLTQDNLCSKYAEILLAPGSEIAPAFGAGCCSPLFNQRREAKIAMDAVREKVKVPHDA